MSLQGPPYFQFSTSCNHIIKHICYPYFCYWITTNQIDHLVKRGSIKGVIFFSLSCRKSNKRWFISGPCDATTIDSAKSQQLVVGVFYFLTWHDMDVRRHAFSALELLTLNEKKLSLVSSGESLVLIHELPNLNHQILIINHSVPWLNLTSLGKQSPFPYFMTFDWLQILSRNLNITGKTVQ